jgi:ParB family transcriptional regulator, chromosome partitioning protein
MGRTKARAEVDEVEEPKVRPDVTQKGLDMIGDLRTDALHEALARAPIEDDTLMALLILAFTGMNVTVASGASDNPYGHAKCGPHAARLIGEDGKLSFDRETLVQAARSVLIEVLSLRRNRSDSGLIAHMAGTLSAQINSCPVWRRKTFFHACRAMRWRLRRKRQLSPLVSR